MISFTLFSWGIDKSTHNHVHAGYIPYYIPAQIPTSTVNRTPTTYKITLISPYVQVTNQYQGVSGKHSSSSLLSLAARMVNSCGLVDPAFHFTDTSVNTEYGANKYSCSLIIRVLDTKVMCLTRYLGYSFPFGSNIMRHIAQGCEGLAMEAVDANAAAVSRWTEVAKNPGTRYFLPIMRSKNARCSRRKPPPLHVSPLGG